MLRSFWLFAFCFASIAHAAESIGVRTFHYEDAKRARPIAVELWYPIDDNIAPTPAESDIWVHPQESRGSPLSSRQKTYPLILMSHGNQGDRRERSWLAEALVKANFVVASVDHFGNTRTTYNPLVSMRFWERPRDVSFALDKVLAESFLHERIDVTRIGFTGYSLGGMTGLALAGGVAETAEQVIKAIRARLKEIPSEAFAKIDFSESTRRLSDSRIRSFFLIAPANFIYSASALKKIKAPLGLVVSVDDEVLKHEEHSYAIIVNAIPRKLKVFRRGISHFAFLNKTSEAGNGWLPPKICKDPANCDRAEIHREVGAFAVNFFLDTL